MPLQSGVGWAAGAVNNIRFIKLAVAQKTTLKKWVKAFNKSLYKKSWHSITLAITFN
jgi:hypothetical protein